jgi:ATP-dependent exoDNAse (exonuclease V) beta subunit
MSRNFAEVIRASAGTGKTFSLTNRLLFLILRGADPSTILATTFTRKAAGEIRERLLTRLASACLFDQELYNLGQALELPGISRAQCLSALSTLIAQQHRLKISTLDSFFIQIAKSFGYEAGLPVSWSVLDAGRSGSLVQESVQQLLRSLDPRQATLFIRLCSRGDIKRSVAAELESYARNLFESYRQSTPEAWQWLENFDLSTKIKLEQEVARITNLELPLNSKGIPNSNWQKAFSAALKCLYQKDFSSYLDKTLIRAIATGGEAFHRVKISQEVRDIFLPSIQYARLQVLSGLRDQALALRKILDLFSEQLERIKFSKGLLSFFDIKYHLWNNPGYEQLDDLYFRLDATISHLLLDEFQDTSFAEWRILEPLVEEILSKADGTKSFFCVGDVKQAIYGWRGGVAEIFDSICDRWKQLKESPLDTSYRSSQSVMDLVNLVFSGIAQNRALAGSEAPKNWSKRFLAHKTARNDLEGYVLAFCPQDDQRDFEEDKTLGCFYAAARLMKELNALNGDLEIAALVRTNQHVKLMMDELRACDPRLEVSEEGGNSLSSSATVQSILAALSLIDNPGDEISAFHVASTSLGKVVGLSLPVCSQKCQLLACSLRRQLIEQGLCELLSGWFRALKESGLSGSEAAKVESLIVFSALSKGEFALRPSEFIRFVTTQKVEDSRAAKLRVMTIHQSKGLEFDAVILPDLDRSLKPRTPPLLQWRPGPLSAAEKIVPYISGKYHYIEPVLEEMNEQHKRQTLEEDLSLLYVAITRAKNALYLLLGPSRENEKNMPMTYAGLLRMAFAKEDSLMAGDVLYQAGNPLWHKSIKRKESGISGLPSRVEQNLGSFSSQYKRPVLTVVSPSSIQKEAESLDKLLGISEPRAAELGVLVHALLERVSWVDKSLPDFEELADSIKGPLTSQELLLEACNIVIAAFQRAEFSTVFERQRYADFEAQNECQIELLREKRFAVKDGAKIINGTFDRLVLLIRAGKIEAIEIFDFKTPVSALSRDSSPLRYAAQMESYARSASLMFGVALNLIKTELVYVK